jgi:carboxypeptidase D
MITRRVPGSKCARGTPRCHQLPITSLLSTLVFAAMRVLHRWQLVGLSGFLYSLATLAASTADLPSAASFYVPSLPDLHDAPPSLQIFAGHLPSVPLPSKDSLDTLPNLYFVLTKARRSADRPRLVFWFNGGPGCSSFDGLMMEVGPWRVDGKGGLVFKEGGWEEYTNIVYGNHRNYPL